jgi:hypothetical protein
MAISKDFSIEARPQLIGKLRKFLNPPGVVGGKVSQDIPRLVSGLIMKFGGVYRGNSRI